MENYFIFHSICILIVFVWYSAYMGMEEKTSEEEITNLIGITFVSLFFAPIMLLFALSFNIGRRVGKGK